MLFSSQTVGTKLYPLRCVLVTEKREAQTHIRMVLGCELRYKKLNEVTVPLKHCTIYDIFKFYAEHASRKLRSYRAPLSNVIFRMLDENVMVVIFSHEIEAQTVKVISNLNEIVGISNY